MSLFFNLIHDFFGYRGEQKELHAMLCVIEAHVYENPASWIYETVAVRLYSRRHGTINCYHNREKHILFRDNEVWVKNGIEWRQLRLTKHWEKRISRLSSFICNHQYQKREKERKELARQRYRDETKNYSEVVKRFKPKPPCGGSGVTRCQTSTALSQDVISTNETQKETKTGGSSGLIRNEYKTSKTDYKSVIKTQAF